MSALGRGAAAFGTLSPSLRGILWMLIASASYACTYAIVRQLSGDFTAFQIVFWRVLLGVLFLLPWLMRAGLGAMRTDRWSAYWWRTILNYIGMALLMWGVARLALQDVTALMFTVPLFTVLFVAILLKEKVGGHRWTALAIGFAGALVIVRPGIAEVSLAAIAVLCTSATYGMCNTLTKSLTSTEHPNAVVLWVFLLMLAIGIWPALWQWHTPSLADVPWIVAMGAFSTMATYGTTKALHAADASVVMPYNFTKQPFAVIIGFTFYAEFPDVWTGLGAVIIFGAGWYIARREVLAKRRAKAAAAAGE